MSDATRPERRALTALFQEHSAAERAAEQLNAAGISHDHIELRRGAGPGRSGGGIAHGLAEFFMPERDRLLAAEGLERGETLVVATGVPTHLERRAREILADGALDLRTDDPGPEGASGTLGGTGRATGEFDRLTGQRVGPPPGEDERSDSHGLGGGGSATGEVDRLTGKRIGEPSTPAEPEDEAGAPEQPSTSRT